MGRTGSSRTFPATVAAAFVALATVAFALASPAAAQQAEPSWGIVMHGGAGTITRENMTPEREREIRERMSEALLAGHAVLERGGVALDAVEAAIRILEDSPEFNAGRGAVYAANGYNELDASIMDGRTKMAGAVAGVRFVKNPISLARLVMEETEHVMLAREGALEFAITQGVELVPAEYFYTDRRAESLQRARERARREREDGGQPRGEGPEPADWKLGTVGAAALDRSGNLAAGTSTGGTTHKRWGRIGDSPVIGAGTFADDRCAVSATGDGEYFIRNVVAHDICAQVRYLGIPMRDAADNVVMGTLVEQGATGGVIGIDARGQPMMSFNTPGMYRGHVGADGKVTVEIFRD